MAYCNHCGVYVNEQAEFCPNCHAPLTGNRQNFSGYNSEKTLLRNHPKRGRAIASLVLGVCSCALLNIPCGILAIVFGASARKAAKHAMATAGLTCGIIGVSLASVAWIFILLFYL